MLRAEASADVVACPIPLLRRDDVPHADRAIRRNELTRIARGVFVGAAEWERLAPWDRYLARVHATALRVPSAMFILESAAALRGLPVFGEPRDIHIVAPPLATSRTVSGVRVHTAEELPEIEEIGGLLVATPPEIAVGIARSRHHAIGLTVAGAVLRASPGLDRTHLSEVNRTKLTSRGRRHAGWVVERATGVPESPLEHLSLAVIEWLGFPAPGLQKWILGGNAGDDDRLDFWWEADRIGGEADGDKKYAGLDAAQVLRSRRDRDQRLLERGVRGVAHWAWTDAVRATPLRAALMAAGLRPTQPENTAELHSLARLLGADPRQAAASRPTSIAKQQ